MYPIDTGNDGNLKKLDSISDYIFGPELTDEKAYFETEVKPYFDHYQDGGIYKNFKVNG